MDEVDGMTGDRGGTTELVQWIKKSSRPIICICNDREKSQMKTLAQYCLDLKFKQPSSQEIMQILDVIVSHEMSPQLWRSMDKTIIREIIEDCQNDIRQTLNYV